MSIRLIDEVYRKRQIDARLQRVLLCLCDAASDEGVCFPSVGQIAWKLGTSERTVERAIDDMKEMGAVVVEPRAGRSNVYTIHLEALPEKALYVPPKQRQNDTPDKMSPPDKLSPQTRQIVAPTSRQNDAHNRQENRQIEPSTIAPNGARSPQVQSVSLPGIPTPIKPWRDKTEKTKSKELPENGPAQQIVKAYCKTVDIEKPVNYRKSVGQAQQLADAGITPEQIPEIIEWIRSTQKWINGVDFSTVVSMSERWQVEIRNETKKIKRVVV